MSNLKIVVGSAILVDQQGRILYGRRVRCNKYTMPGGKIEGSETIKDGLVREVLEEVGLKVDPKDMELLGFCDLPSKVIFFYLILPGKWRGKIRNKEPDKHRDWEWHGDAPENCVDGLKWFNEHLRKYTLTKISERTR